MSTSELGPASPFPVLPNTSKVTLASCTMASISRSCSRPRKSPTAQLRRYSAAPAGTGADSDAASGD
eukprot:scaffold2771_cov252-Pinguiococcus_pyrenoidosus.AAC.7